MKRSSKLLLFVSVLAITVLACATFSGNNSNGDTAGAGAGGEANILYEDDFSNPNSGWDVYNDTEGVTDYANGAYKIAVNVNSMYYWANPYKSFDDVIVEVEAQKTAGGDDMQYGLICRHQDVDNWYTLIVSADGFAAIRKKYQGGELDFITDWVEVPSLNTGNATNLLRAECVGSRLALYVNGELAIETTDSDFAAGDVGLMAGTFENANSTEVLFDNFVVRKP